MKRTRIPEQYVSLSCMLSVGQVVPVRPSPNHPTLSLLMKVDDHFLDRIKTQPPLTVMPGIVIYQFGNRKMPLLYFLVRLNDDPKLTYQMQFNIFQRDQLQDWKIFGQQNGLTSLLVDGKSCVSFKVFPNYHKHMHMLLALAQKHASRRILPSEALHLSQLIDHKTKSPSGLWDNFVRFRCVIQLTHQHPQTITT